MLKLKNIKKKNNFLIKTNNKSLNCDRIISTIPLNEFQHIFNTPNRIKKFQMI